MELEEECWWVSRGGDEGEDIQKSWTVEFGMEAVELKVGGSGDSVEAVEFWWVEGVGWWWMGCGWMVLACFWVLWG